MNSILAQIRKDLYLNWYIIIAYLTLQAIGIILQWNIIELFHSSGIELKAALFIEEGSRFIAIFLAGYIFITDPDTHTDAFCLTKPLNPRRRTIAKLILISGVLFTPIISSNLFYTIQYGGNYFSMVSRDIALYSSFFIGAGIASLSRSIPRFIINTLVIIFCSMFAYNLLNSFFNFLAVDSPYQSITQYWSTNVFAETFNLIVTAIYISIAFLSLKRRMQIHKIGLALVLMWPVVNVLLFHPNLNIIRPLQKQASPTQFQVIQKAFFEPDVYVGLDGQNARELKNTINFELETIHSQPDTDVRAQLLDGHLVVEDKILHPSYDYQLYKWMDESFSLSLNGFESSLDKIQLLNKDQLESKEPISFIAIDISNEVLDALQGKKARYEGRVGLISAKYSKIATVPLDPNASFKSDYYFGKIDAVNKQGKQIDVSVTVAASIDPFDRASPVWTRIPYWSIQEHRGREILLLYNSKTNEALIPETLRTPSDYITRSQIIWNAALSKYELSFKLTEAITDEWLENAEILIIEKKVVRTQDEDFTVENIIL